MVRIGLMAGKGSLPVDFVRSAKARGERVVVFALKGVADPELEKIADRVYWMEITQYGRFLFLLIRERVRSLVLLGKFEKNVMYQDDRISKRYARDFKKLSDRKDYSILKELTRRLAMLGIKVIDPLDHLSHLLPEKGILTSLVPDQRIIEDMTFGYDVAKKLAGMDIGQTVIIKNKVVVAVEAMEGTDAALERAASIAGDGCVMVKVSRPDQDMRWDVPVVGSDTIKKLADNRFGALAIESGRMFIMDREEAVFAADKAGLVIQVL
jgi:UDP-2,3-diacylglucosamine hydrolase